MIKLRSLAKRMRMVSLMTTVVKKTTRSVVNSALTMSQTMRTISKLKMREAERRQLAI